MFIDKHVIEIMDSNGLMSTIKQNKFVREFVCLQSLGKTVYATPQLQSDNSSSCGKFALVFLYYRSIIGSSLCKFAQAFTYNLDQNEKKIKSFYRIITK